MNEHKDEILQTRKGCLGGSDAKMLYGIARLGSVPKSAYKRLAVCKGLIEQENFTNRAMELGNFIEDCVFKHLHETDERWQSNPCLTSKMYSRSNVKCIDHVDFYLQDDENKVITIGECKAVKLNFQQTRYDYDAQLMHHYLLGLEQANMLGGYKVKVMLCHYDTSDVNLDDPFEFDTSKLTVKKVKFGNASSYELSKAMDIVNDFLETFTEYYDGDEVAEQYLPLAVKEQFNTIAGILMEIKEREKKVDEFKARLYAFMCEKNVKSIKGEAFSISRVDESESKSFDGKRFLEELKEQHPRKANALAKKYAKITKRNGYAVIKVKEKKEQE